MKLRRDEGVVGMRDPIPEVSTSSFLVSKLQGRRLSWRHKITSRSTYFTVYYLAATSLRSHVPLTFYNASSCFLSTLDVYSFDFDFNKVHLSLCLK